MYCCDNSHAAATTIAFENVNGKNAVHQLGAAVGCKAKTRLISPIRLGTEASIAGAAAASAALYSLHSGRLNGGRER